MTHRHAARVDAQPRASAASQSDGLSRAHACGAAASDPVPVDSVPRWYCVQTRPRCELLARENLLRQGFRTFLPRARVLRLRQGRRMRVVEPMFPRYLFLRAQPQVESLAPIRSTRGVLGLVRFGERIAEVPDALMERLQRDADADGFIAFATGAPRVGDRVRVLEGPFLGLEAIYQCDRGEDRAVILLTLLGREQRIAVPTTTLERLAPSG